MSLFRRVYKVATDIILGIAYIEILLVFVATHGTGGRLRGACWCVGFLSAEGLRKRELKVEAILLCLGGGEGLLGSSWRAA